MRELSNPLIEPEPWVFKSESTGHWVVVESRTWIDARERAPIEHARLFGGVPPSDLVVAVNPVKRPARARAVARLIRYRERRERRFYVRALFSGPVIPDYHVTELTKDEAEELSATIPSWMVNAEQVLK